MRGISMQSMSCTKPRTKNRWKYVYAIITSRKEIDFGQIGIDDENVHTIHYRDIAAVVSGANKKTYEVLDYGISHQMILEKVMKEFCLIPMSFGQITTEGEIKTFLSQNYLKLKDLFTKLNGKKELGVKVSWNIDSTIKEIAASNIKIRTMNKQIIGKPLEKTYRMRLELGTKVAKELNILGNKIGSDIFGRLRAVSVDSRQNKNLSDEMVLNAAFLVDNNKEQDFDNCVNNLEHEYGDMVNMKYVVAPPFNFVNIKIRR
jgi:hypothetical protein